MVKISPLFNQVLLERVPEKETTEGGIIIPDNSKERPQEAVVIAVGPGRMTDYGVVIPMFVHVGEHVLFGRYSGVDIEIEGNPYVLMREEELQALVVHISDDSVQNEQHETLAADHLESAVEELHAGDLQ